MYRLVQTWSRLQPGLALCAIYPIIPYFRFNDLIQQHTIFTTSKILWTLNQMGMIGPSGFRSIGFRRDGYWTKWV